MRKIRHDIGLIEANDQISDLPEVFNSNAEIAARMFDRLEKLEQELADLRQQLKRVEEARGW